MAAVKTVLVWMAVCALLGVVASTFFATQVVGWYNQPGGGSAAMCNCSELAHTTVTQIIQWQVGGLATGAVGGLVAGVMFVRWRRLKAKAALALKPAAVSDAAPPSEAPKG